MKTTIEWTEFTCNCFWGCTHGCSYCQARRFAKRFAGKIGRDRGYSPELIQRLRDFLPTFLPDQLERIPKKPCKVFMSFMGEPFSPEFKEYLPLAFGTMRLHPNHIFQMLTKRPENLIKWSPFPENCWVGVSVTDGGKLMPALDALDSIQCSKRFISAEPLLGSFEQKNHYLPLLFQGTLDLIIIGQCTPVRAKTAPKIEWVRDIVSAADKAGVAVFLKDNLNSCEISDYPELLDSHGNLRQEFPK